MTPKRNLTIGIGFGVLLIGLGLVHHRLEQIALAQNRPGVQAPRFEVDPFWPKPLPNHWLLGNAIGIWVDAQDNVWIIHRGSDTLNNNERGLELKSGDCCAGAPPVLVFDKAGNPDSQLGRSRAGLRLARQQPRHLRRSHRQRVDWRKRPGRLAHREVHPGREVPGAVRQAERAPEREGRAGQSDVHPEQP